jgi:hypothetical protein
MSGRFEVEVTLAFESERKADALVQAMQAAYEDPTAWLSVTVHARAGDIELRVDGGRPTNWEAVQ